jgi:hypothetical protein
MRNGVQPTSSGCPLRVNRAVLTVGRSLPVFPQKQTFSVSGGMSQTCPETDIGADLVSRAAERLALTRDQRPSYLALEDDHRRLLRMDAPAW